MTDTTQHRLQPGDTAPAFTLQDQEGRPVSLRDSAGKHTIVYFYPAAVREARLSRKSQACVVQPGVDAAG